jgi:hypothetical protein
MQEIACYKPLPNALLWIGEALQQAMQPGSCLCLSAVRVRCCGQSAVNLLSSVLDTPEFFWRAPDSYQSLYQAICQVTTARGLSLGFWGV